MYDESADIFPSEHWQMFLCQWVHDMSVHTGAHCRHGDTWWWKPETTTRAAELLRVEVGSLHCAQLPVVSLFSMDKRRHQLTNSPVFPPIAMWHSQTRHCQLHSADSMVGFG